MQPSIHSFQPTYHLDVHLQPDENIFEFVQRRFALHHGARIQTLLPWQCTLSDEQGTLLASAGLNPASTGPLFLEHYLESPVEQQLACSCNNRSYAMTFWRSAIWRRWMGMPVC